MNKEELDSFEELNINLQDIDDLDMGLEIISYKVRKSLQELADIIINQSCQISTYKEKEDKLREYCNEQVKDMTKLESIFTGEETKEYVLLNGFLQILNEGGKE